MQVQFEAAMQTKRTLEDDATATQRRMDSANLLLQELSGGGWLGCTYDVCRSCVWAVQAHQWGLVVGMQTFLVCTHLDA